MAENFLITVGDPRLASGNTLGASKIYRHSAAKDGFPTLDGVTTLYELFDKSAKQHAQNKCLGFRPIKDGAAGGFQWYTYKEVADQVAKIASGFAGLGIAAGQRVGVYGGNCCEWMMVMQACNRMSFQCVPLYDSLGENAVEYIINHSEAVVVCVEGKKLPNLAKAAKGVTEHLKHVVYWGTGDKKAEEALQAAGVSVQSLEQLTQAGAAKPAEPVPPKPDDYCTIMYTSGTTGDPKGVLLKHSAVVSTVASLLCFLDNTTSCSLGPEDSMLSYLPLAHIFDRTAEEMFLQLGASIGYWQGDALKLVDDIGALKPTMFIGVPRVYDRIYNRVKDQINQAGGLKKILFNWAFERKKYWLQQGVPQAKASPFCDRLVFGKVKQRLGGQVRLIVSGGAPLAPHVEEFLKVAMCAPVVQGYGLTETCAGSAIALPDFWPHFASNGPPLPGTEIRLESVPEMNYDATKEDEPAGEVLIRGPGLFSGYYKMQEKTAEVMDKDGWFHTGDIGKFTKEGGLKIIDRKKNIFKLSQGEYIAVEKLEGTFKQAPCVEQVWVYGDSFKSVLVAVVVPKADAIKEWAKEAGKTGSVAELVKLPEAEQWVLDQLTAAGKADKLKGFELIKAVALESELFSCENDLLTPTFKFKRPQLQKKYQAAIDAMYQKLGQ